MGVSVDESLDLATCHDVRRRDSGSYAIDCDVRVDKMRIPPARSLFTRGRCIGGCVEMSRRGSGRYRRDPERAYRAADVLLSRSAPTWLERD
jgi:hypothetical protein